jgi:probable HAF family extracellular repeat protein
MSADGTTIVGTSYSGAGHEAFRWVGGVMTGLGFLPGGISSDPASVSADGTVVVGQGNSASGTQAFRWTGGMMTGLGDLPGGIFQSNATDVSNDGSVVVGIGSSPEDVSEAFIWTETTGMERLFDVLVTNGATGLTGWNLRQVSISGDGKWVAGYGINPNGSPEAFLANISAVPVPTAVWLFGSALGVIGSMWRKVGRLAH